VLLEDIPFRELIGQCRDFMEMTGEAGDVVLLHPYVLHATSQNVLGVARFIFNPPLTLRQPMNFDRDAKEYSLVEQAVLRGLGVDRLRYQPSAPREQEVPQRVLDERTAVHSD